MLRLERWDEPIPRPSDDGGGFFALSVEFQEVRAMKTNLYVTCATDREQLELLDLLRRRG